MAHIKNRIKNKFIKNVLSCLLCLVAFMAVSITYSYARPNSLSLIRDTEIETILKSWSEPIFKAAGLDPKAINIILVRSDDINAFVAGGQNIFIYTGLILKTESPEELIGVIAHETGHIAGGHLIRTRAAMERASYESIISTILGVGAAIVSGDASAIPAISLGGSHLAQRGYLAHSRIQESSADQAALSFLEKAKTNPSGLSTFMNKLKGDIYVAESQQSEYIRTHPLVDSRIDALMRRTEQSKYKDQSTSKEMLEQHARIKAKLIGFINPGQIPWVYDDRDTSIPPQYARTIASYQNNNVEQAIKRVDILIDQEPNNPYFLELKGQMLVDFGQVKEALPFYQEASKILPDDPLLHIALAHALIESKRDNDAKILNDAINHLKHALQEEPRSTRIHRLLATAYGRLGQKNQARLHLAEEAVLQRRYSYATEHIETILLNEPENSPTWIKAKDMSAYIKTVSKR